MAAVFISTAAATVGVLLLESSECYRSWVGSETNDTITIIYAIHMQVIYRTGPREGSRQTIFYVDLLFIPSLVDRFLAW